MEGLEPKKLALLRIFQILEKYSDADHPLLQENIIRYLDDDYGIILERKAISRNLKLLKEAGFEIVSDYKGCYLSSREFTDSEIRILIDGVLSSQYISSNYSKKLIDKLCALTSKHFRTHIRHMHSVNEWFKTNNQEVFYNIELVDEAIENEKQICFDYNKYGIDKKMHRVNSHQVSPYQLIMQKQRYYLMARDERYGDLCYFRMDRITNMSISKATSVPVTSISRFKNGINYAEISTTLPYMFSDAPVIIEFYARESIVDDIIDWFGLNTRIVKKENGTVKATVKASPKAMKLWCLQYAGSVIVTNPVKLAEEIREKLAESMAQYGAGNFAASKTNCADTGCNINYKLLDFNNAPPEKCIELMIGSGKTSEYIAFQSWPSDVYYEYDINGNQVDRYNIYRLDVERIRRCREENGVSPAEVIKKRYSALIGSLTRIADAGDKLGKTVDENIKILSAEDLRVWDIYISFANGYPHTEQMEVIFDKTDIGEKLTDEEEKLLEEHDAELGRESAARLKKISMRPVSGYSVIIRAKRVCRLLELGAPDIVVKEEEKLLAQALVINEYAVSLKSRVEEDQLATEFLKL